MIEPHILVLNDSCTRMDGMHVRGATCFHDNSKWHTLLLCRFERLVLPASVGEAYEKHIQSESLKCHCLKLKREAYPLSFSCKPKMFWRKTKLSHPLLQVEPLLLHRQAAWWRSSSAKTGRRGEDCVSPPSWCKHHRVHLRSKEAGSQRKEPTKNEVHRVDTDICLLGTFGKINERKV